MHIAEKALSSPSEVFIRMPGEVPNLKILDVFGASSPNFAAVTFFYNGLSLFCRQDITNSRVKKGNNRAGQTPSQKKVYEFSSIHLMGFFQMILAFF